MKNARNGQRPPRLADVARVCGLARSTVSNALNGTGTISARTRRRVQETAEKLGYQPNVHAATLAYSSRRWENRMEVVPVAVLYTGPESFVEQWIERSWLEASFGPGLKFAFTLRNLDKGFDPRRLSRQLYDRGVQGVVLSRMLKKPQLQGFDWSRFSVVQDAGRCLPEWPFDQVRHSPANSMRRLLRLALERGYRRPGCVLYTHPEAIDDDEVRLGEALAFNAINVKKNPVPPYTASFEDLRPGRRFVRHRAALLAWYREHRPDCVIGFNPAPYHILRYCGVDLPAEAGYLSYMLNYSDSENHCISGFWEERYEVARECLDRLLFLITRSRKGAPKRRRTIIVEPEFNEGTTIRAAKRALDK